MPRRSVPAGIAELIVRSPDSAAVGPARSGVHRRRARRRSVFGHLAQDRHETLDPGFAAEDEVGADDRGPGRGRGRARRATGAADGRFDGVALGASDGSTDGLAGLLGPGVRSGPPGSSDGVGAAVGTDPRPPVEPPHAATVATSMPDDEDR